MRCSKCGRDAKGHPKPMGDDCELPIAEALIDLQRGQRSPSDQYRSTASSSSTISIGELVDQMSQPNATVVQLA